MDPLGLVHAEARIRQAGGDRFDPEINIAAAAYLVYADGWWHWGTFNGNYGCYDWVVHALENPL